MPINQDVMIDKQIKVERRFFQPVESKSIQKKHQGELLRISKAFTSARENKGSPSIELNQVSPRVHVMADGKSIFDATQKQKPNKFNYYTHLFPQGHKSTYGQSFIYWSREESVRSSTPNGSFAMSTSVQKVSSHMNHKGDCRVDFEHAPTVQNTSPSYITGHDIGSYSWISEKIATCAPQMKTQEKIATLFLELGDTPKVVSEKQLSEALDITEVSRDQLEKFHELQGLIKQSPANPVLHLFLTTIQKEGSVVEAMSKLPTVSHEQKEQFGRFAFLYLKVLQEEKPDVGKKLSRLLLTSAIPSKESRPIKKRDLEAIGVDGSVANVQFFNDLYHLLFIKEIARRRSPGDEKIDLPYAFSLIQGLKLIGKNVDGSTLSLSRLLHPEGPLFFTGASFVKGNDTSEAKAKISRLNTAYAAAFPEEADRMGSWKEMRRTLARHYGGASDTEDEGYESN